MALKRLRANIIRMERDIEAALKEDLGKGAAESYMCETGMVLSELSCTLKNIGKWSRTRKVHTPLAQFPARSRIIPEPYGNVLIMSPWNYPFLLCISPLVSAIAAGNTAIVKPSAYAPATSRVISQLVSGTFEPGHAAVIHREQDGRQTRNDKGRSTPHACNIGTRWQKSGHRGQDRRPPHQRKKDGIREIPQLRANLCRTGLCTGT